MERASGPAGLALGLTVVTTSETGLAEWLADNGHAVLPPNSSNVELSQVIAARLTTPLDRNVVLRSLPSSNGRIDADKWLHSI
jgi:hypothetical protein